MKKRRNEKINSRVLSACCKALIGMLAAAILLVVGCRLAVRSAEYPFHWQGRQAALEERYDCIIVPGAAVAGGVPQTHLQDRLDTAVTLYKAGVADRILLSGGYDEKAAIWESRVMMVYLSKRGIPEEAMLLDDYGYDTAETLRRAKALIGEGRAIICTQSLYADRTAYLAERFGLSAEIADSDIRIYTVGNGKARVREFFAATKAVFEGAFSKGCRYSLADFPMKGGAENA